MSDLTPQERLIRLRKIFGFTQRELADEFRVSYGAVCLWEAGKRPVPGPVLKLLDLYENRGSQVEHGDLHERFHGLINEIGLLQKLDPKDVENLDREVSGFLQEHFFSNRFNGHLLARKMLLALSFLSKKQGLSLKIIQALSYMEFGLPKEIRDTLGEIAEKAKPLHESVVERVLLEAFGKKSKQLFSSWNKKPLAVTSLAQVHKARLEDGTWVAVKIQNPDAEKILRKQFRVLRLLLRLSSAFADGNEVWISGVLGSIEEELDYEREARNTRLIGNLFDEDEEILIPKVYGDYSSKTVLTTEYLDGQDFKEFISRSGQNAKDQAVKVLHRFITRSLMSHGIMYADPSPSNFKFSGGKLAVVDFGRVIHYDQTRFELEQRLLKSLFYSRYDLAEKYFLKMNIVKDPKKLDCFDLWSFMQGSTPQYYSRGKAPLRRELLRKISQSSRHFLAKDHLKRDMWLFWIIFIQNSLFSLLSDLGGELDWREELGAILSSITI